MPIITVIGSLNYDIVTYTPIVPNAGQTVQANSFETHPGGKGLNEALACARLSESDNIIRMIGNIGDDSFGSQLKSILVKNDVDVNWVKTVPGSSGVAVILVEENAGGENRILITPGANGELKPTEQEYQVYFPKSEDCTFVVLQNEYPDTIKSIKWIKSNRPSINIAYNPSPFRPELITLEMLGMLDLLIVNEGEALDVAQAVLPENEYKNFLTKTNNKDGFVELCIKLQSLINKDNINCVIITMGSKGAVYVTSELASPKFQEAKKVANPVDTTGAGDTFFGAVVSQLSSGNTIENAVKFATAASSLAVQKRGAAESIPTYDDVVKIV
ncbi:ribokinase [Spathaspora passalidarum NRRL Y-27907]|uniref:Ribokinase n=1 Tax=Spathaspora passalidarum (strain NRRL Y-27907 / 11-Y1) TaxID=619300 RepID=G3ANL8_SPAPN|nr:ribokinase [Spathaspora passalidarum NRRL Y-27907]EGW32547.1 ribokinase [Spathaspora passalidarum NRRL Y-27907]